MLSYLMGYITDKHESGKSRGKMLKHERIVRLVVLILPLVVSLCLVAGPEHGEAGKPKKPEVIVVKAPAPPPKKAPPPKVIVVQQPAPKPKPCPPPKVIVIKEQAPKPKPMPPKIILVKQPAPAPKPRPPEVIIVKAPAPPPKKEEDDW